MVDRCQGLEELLRNIEGMDDLVRCLEKNQSVKVVQMVDACKAHFACSVATYVAAPIVVLTYDEMSARRLADDIEALRGRDKVLIYPARDILFYNADVHSMDITSSRLKVVDALVNHQDVTIIIPIDALLNPISPRETYESYTLDFKVGGNMDLAGFEKKMIQMGYERVGKVEGIGQFSVRGGIIDIYPAISEEAYRIELWDDEIDSIRSFNVQTQRSIEKADEIRITPNQEIIFPLELLKQSIPNIKEDLEKVKKQLLKDDNKEGIKRIQEQVQEVIEYIMHNISPKGLETYIPYTNIGLVSLLDYISKDTIIVMNEPIKIKEKSLRVVEEYRISMEQRLEYGHILPKQLELLFDYENILFNLEHFRKLLLMNFDSLQAQEYKADYTLKLDVVENNINYKSLDLFKEDLLKWQKDQQKIIILCNVKAKAMRMIDELSERDIIVGYTEDLNHIESGQIIICKGYLCSGFYYRDLKLCIVADKDLFGKEKRNRRVKKKYSGTKIQSFLELSKGDYVVHEDYGIGVFKGIEQIQIEGISKDNLKIEYADGSSLYVNINQMDKVQKYVGAEGKTPKLNKIGGSEWKKSKAKVKGAIKDIAKELIKLYSKRQYSRGFHYEPDTVWQREFEELFPYEETGDQLDAIEEVKKDMESDKIMDRLICGDVGYGKTEVAIRAAFKAVQNSKQVAYLVPTTILAQQHYSRFVERMKDYPVRVELLSRFRTPKQIKETLQAMQNGMADIVIGTHRLLSKDVKFKDLGLVIIDEEQRFGVTHKEKLKQMRTQVDVMNLTATPIPRTLHMSLIGVRDMSVLEEAPVERKAVQTYVIEYSEDFVKDAIDRELSRGGQVYFLHNQVRDIEEKALRIQKLVPNAQITFAHGQMSERELESIMLDFISGEIDVLVCTTIIETGLDISNANTIIINNADKMGLSQLYQLRGRVGRSNRMGYAYLMYERNKALKEVAEKRLQAIKQFTELGAGFKIAMRDLEIRGAGNLLGAQQHGHMESIGYDLYCKMLAEVVSEEKGEIPKEEYETTVEIKINAYIPESYIIDEIQKLDIYKKIASITNEKDYLEVQEEIEDRYGNIPEVTYNLLDIALIKAMAHALGIILVSYYEGQAIFKFKKDTQLDVEVFPLLMEKYRKNIKFVNEVEPIVKVKLSDTNKTSILNNIKNILHDFKKLNRVHE